MSTFTIIVVAIGVIAAAGLLRKLGLGAVLANIFRAAIALTALVYWYKQAGSINVMVDQAWAFAEAVVDWVRSVVGQFLDDNPDLTKVK